MRNKIGDRKAIQASYNVTHRLCPSPGCPARMKAECADEVSLCRTHHPTERLISGRVSHKTSVKVALIEQWRVRSSLESPRYQGLCLAPVLAALKVTLISLARIPVFDYRQTVVVIRIANFALQNKKNGYYVRENL